MDVSQAQAAIAAQTVQAQAAIAQAAQAAQHYPMAFHPLNLFNQAYGAMGNMGSNLGYPTAVNNFGQFLWRKKRSLLDAIKSTFKKK